MLERILVVDDTLSLLDLVRDLLEAEQFAVTTCILSREAYALAARLRPKLVILDIVMPELSGWDVLALLRQDPLLRRIPVVICTAWAEEAAGRMRDLCQPDLWLLPKPFEPDELLATVAEALDSAERPRPVDHRA